LGHGEARHGEARRGKARQGEAGHGKEISKLGVAMDEKTFFDKEQPEGWGHNFMEKWSDVWDDLTRSVSRPPEKHDEKE